MFGRGKRRIRFALLGPVLALGLAAPAHAAVNVTAAPTISGTAMVGSKLTANGGTWTGPTGTTVGRIWLRCTSSSSTSSCAQISGTNSTTYTLTTSDQAQVDARRALRVLGHRLRLGDVERDERRRRGADADADADADAHADEDADAHADAHGDEDADAHADADARRRRRRPRRPPTKTPTPTPTADQDADPHGDAAPRRPRRPRRRPSWRRSSRRRSPDVATAPVAVAQPLPAMPACPTRPRSRASRPRRSRR